MVRFVIFGFHIQYYFVRIVTLVIHSAGGDTDDTQHTIRHIHYTSYWYCARVDACLWRQRFFFPQSGANTHPNLMHHRSTHI